MTAMVVRCGRCRTELEVSGPGEFICPACGTRNAVRGAAAASPFGMGQGVSGLTLPGGAPAPAAGPPAGPQPSVDWVSCDSCNYRFMAGPVERVTCPNCRNEIERPADARMS
jgi:predicted RNA-binding Zn-ribbon protein involved in translation (DUF1610 family)